MQHSALFNRVRVSTRDFPNTMSEKRRISMWGQHWASKWRELNGYCPDCEVAPVVDVRFCADLIMTRLPELTVNTLRRSPARVVIRPECAAPTDFLCVGAFRSGCAVWIEKGKTIAEKIGTAGVVTADSRWEVVRHSAGTFTSVVFSAPAIAKLVPGVASLSGASIPAQNPALRLLIQYLDLIQSGEGFDTIELARSASTHVLDLAALALGARGDAARLACARGAKAARFAKITADIRALVGNCDLSADDIAARYRISPRYVRKLFEEAGTSFSAFVLTERLEKIRRMLGDQRYAHLSIAEVAYESGFGDLSYFNRTFKRHFGARPSEFREMSQTLQTG